MPKPNTPTMPYDHRYDDILTLARPQSTRPKMPVADRAAQFSPFAALTGYAEAVEAEARRVEGMAEQLPPDAP